MATVAGWGQVEPDKMRDNTLRTAHQRVLNISDCKHFENAGYTFRRDIVKPEQLKIPGDEEPQICVGDPVELKATCNVCCV